MIINVLRNLYRTYIRGSGNRHKDAPRVDVDWEAVARHSKPMLYGVDLAAEPPARTWEQMRAEARLAAFANTDPFTGLDPKMVPRGTSSDTEIATVIYRPFVNYKPQLQRVPPKCCNFPRATRTSAATTQAKRRRGKASGSRR